MRKCIVFIILLITLSVNAGNTVFEGILKEMNATEITEIVSFPEAVKGSIVAIALTAGDNDPVISLYGEHIGKIGEDFVTLKLEDRYLTFKMNYIYSFKYRGDYRVGGATDKVVIMISNIQGEEFKKYANFMLEIIFIDSDVETVKILFK